MGQGWICRTSSGECAAFSPGPGGGAVSITASVGNAGANRPDDVRRIQAALNRVRPGKGGPIPLLVVDGICGPKTIAAISNFQKQQIGWSDGRIDPGHATLAKLNEVLAGGDGPDGPGENPPPRRERVVGFIAEAFRTVRAAQANVLLALPLLETGGAGGTLPGSSREERLALLNKHFQIEKQASPAATAHRVLYVYDRMRQVFERAGGLWGPAVFETDPDKTTSPTTMAYTYPGGFDRGGEKDGALRKDSIFLCELLDRLPNDQIVMTIVHELSHFVGPTTGAIIDDHGYGWVDTPRMKNLRASVLPSNAESYNNFAFDAANHRVPAR